MELPSILKVRSKSESEKGVFPGLLRKEGKSNEVRNVCFHKDSRFQGSVLEIEFSLTYLITPLSLTLLPLVV